MISKHHISYASQMSISKSLTRLQAGNAFWEYVCYPGPSSDFRTFKFQAINRANPAPVILPEKKKGLTYLAVAFRPFSHLESATHVFLRNSCERWSSAVARPAQCEDGSDIVELIEVAGVIVMLFPSDISRLLARVIINQIFLSKGPFT